MKTFLQPLAVKKKWAGRIPDPTVSQKMTLLSNWLKKPASSIEEPGKISQEEKNQRVIFYGPAGSGKKQAVSALGINTGKQVYRVDLSMVISKYIGETEKNLDQLFAHAENKNWILFFDEADALFGKRTSVKDAHDRYASQEISYLLQKMENYNGLVILSCSNKKVLDEAFLRRFQMVVDFPAPRKHT